MKTHGSLAFHVKKLRINEYAIGNSPKTAKTRKNGPMKKYACLFLRIS